jgi:hypothetical protein
MDKGWVKINRSLVDWQWWSDHNATRLLLYLIVSVNYEDKKWKGELIKAGSMVLSWGTLSKKVGLSLRQVRTAMQKLVESGEIVKKVTNRYQVVTLTKWEQMQITEKKMTGRRQADDRQMTPTKETKEIKKKVPPTKLEFMLYLKDDYLKDKSAMYERHRGFMIGSYDAWLENGWKDGFDKPIKNWKSKAMNQIKYQEQKWNSRKKN